MYSFFFSTPLFAANDEKEVIAMGVGVTEETAKHQAYRNAIQSVIGSMVLSETIVQNDTLVRDKILSHSAGYVVKALPVGSPRILQGGLVEVTVRVTVKNQQLQQKLQAENISTAKVDGQSLFAQKKTRDEAKQDAANIIAEKLKDIPSSVLIATALPDKAKQESKGNMVSLTLPVEVSVDKTAYKVFIKDFINTLKKLGFSSRSFSRTGRQYANRNSLEFDRIRFSDKNEFFLSIIEVVFRDDSSVRGQILSLSEEAFKAIVNARQVFQLKIELLDSNKNVIVEKISSYSNKLERDVWTFEGTTPQKLYINLFSSVLKILRYVERGSSHAVIYPEVAYYFKHRTSDLILSSKDTLTANILFNLTEEELASIASVKCTIVNIPVPQQ